MRHFRRARRSFRPLVKTYKKVLDYAPASRVAATNIEFTISTGVDSLAIGQGGVTDELIPTGSRLQLIHIDVPFGYTAAATAFFWLSIQLIHTGQSSVNPRVVGGNAQRNQVMFQKMFMLGSNQNLLWHKDFKIPKRFQRVREGDKWMIVYQSDVAHASGAQIIYKVEQ